MTEVYNRNMPRNEAEARRLDQSFSLMTRNIGYLLHPTVRTVLSSSTPMVMDLATGTGVFLRHLSPSYPDATLHGTDISSELFAEDLPKNVTLSTLNVKEPIPLELQGKYDLVHVRLLVAALLPADWLPVVQNVSTLLKPGGVIQWEEGNFQDSQIVPGPGYAGATVEAADHVGNIFKQALKENFKHGGESLAETFKTAGLVDVEEDVFRSDLLPETRMDLIRNLFGPVFVLTQKMAGAPEFPTLEKANEMQRQAEIDMDSGACFRFDIHVVTGKKG